MGGRGTGKTTLLWLLASGLDSFVEDDRGIYSLLNSNLGQGKITLTVENLDGEVFEIEKVLGETPIVYASDRTLVDFDSFKENITVDFYKSSQIEEIGTRPEDRLKLIDKHLNKTIKDCKKQESLLFSQLNQNKSTVSDLLIRKRELFQKLEPLEDVEKDLKEHEKLKPEDSEDKAEQFHVLNENQKNREFEKQFREEVENNLKSVNFKLDNLISEISSSISQIEIFETPLNKEIINNLKKSLLPTFQNIKAGLEENKRSINKAQINSDIKAKELGQIHKEQETQFTQLKQKFEKNREYFQRLNQLTKRVTAKAVNKKELDITQSKLEDAIDQRKKLLDSLKGIHQRIYEARLKKIEDINSELNGDVKITLKEGGITHDFEKSLKDALKGKGFNYSEICAKVIENLKPIDFSILIFKEDTRKLAALLGISKDKVKQVIDSLLNTQDIFNIETIYCPDLPKFFLKIDKKEELENQDKENYRQTENLSTGQRCTAILPIVFAASSNPLVIDQPEDNLDNKYIADSIHKIIKRKKDFRQLIFVTHNPNIPVLSDAEYNLFLDYKNRKSKVDANGKIEEVKKSILTLLEGGEEAFKRRSEIYGY